VTTADARGQSLVEFALLTPLCILMVMAVWDGGGVLRQQVVLQQAARDGARLAATGSAPLTAVPLCPTSTIVPANSPVSMAVSSSAGELSPVITSACYPDSTSIRVTASYVYALVTPVLGRVWEDTAGSGKKTLSASATFYLPPARATAIPPPPTPTRSPTPTLTPTPLPPTATPTAAPAVTATPTPPPVGSCVVIDSYLRFINTNTAYSAPCYWVKQTVQVGQNATLTIAPGVTFYFDASAGLIAYGTLTADADAGSRITFTSSSGTTAWAGIDLAGSSASIIRNAVVNYGGGGNPAYGVRIESSSPTLETVSIANSSGYGIDLEYSGSNPRLTNVTVSASASHGIYVGPYAACPAITNARLTGNTGYGLYLDVGPAFACDPGAAALIAANYTSNGGGNRVFLSGGFLASTGTVRSYGIPYEVGSTIQVNNGATLNILPGTILQFDAGAQMLVYGSLVADATVAAPITLITANASPAAGQWPGVYLSGVTSTVLRNVAIRFAGSGASDRFGLRIDSSSPTVDQVTIDQSGGYGVELQYAGTPTLSNLAVSNSTSHGIFVADNAGCPSITTATLTGNGGYGLYLGSGVGFVCDTGAATLSAAAYTANANANRVYVSGGFVSGNRQVRNYGPAYVVGTDLQITPGSTLSIAAGTDLLFPGGVGVVVYGRLDAIGTGNQIVLSSASAVPAAGQWEGVDFAGGSSGQLSCVAVQYAGSRGFGVRSSTSNTMTWDHLTLKSNATTGFSLDGGSNSIAITASNFQNSPARGIITNGAAVNATASWWGSLTSTGPGTGGGDSVSGPGVTSTGSVPAPTTC
jgi:Flp pilus assembly protein TadG